MMQNSPERRGWPKALRYLGYALAAIIAVVSLINGLAWWFGVGG